MRRSSGLSLLLVAATAVTGCPPGGPREPNIIDPLPVALCDAGALHEASWRSLGFPSKVAGATALAVVGTDVLLGTPKGLWRRPLDGSGEWTRSGLEDLAVLTILALPEHPDRVFVGGRPTAPGVLPFQSSTDGGHTWSQSGADLFDESLGELIPVEHLTRQRGPGGVGVLYANMSGPSVARSDDAGASWHYVVGEPFLYANYPCVVHVPEGDPGVLFHGCEAPLDFAWVTRHALRDDDGELGEGEKVLGLEELSNRRPNSFASGPGRPKRVYAGLEGALIWIEGDEWGWVFQHEGEAEDFGEYTYVKAIWIDPCDPDHLVYGGTVNGFNERLNLYETFDHGGSSAFVDAAVEVPEDPRVEEGVAAGESGKDLVLLVRPGSGPSEARVIVRSHER